MLLLLNKKWENLNDNNRSLLTLFECFESVIFAIKSAIEPYAQIIFERCLRILRKVLLSINTNYENLSQEIDFYIRSMDLISSIISALNIKCEFLI